MRPREEVHFAPSCFQVVYVDHVTRPLLVLQVALHDPAHGLVVARDAPAELRDEVVEGERFEVAVHG